MSVEGIDCHRQRLNWERGWRGTWPVWEARHEWEESKEVWVVGGGDGARRGNSVIGQGHTLDPFRLHGVNLLCICYVILISSLHAMFVWAPCAPTRAVSSSMDLSIACWGTCLTSHENKPWIALHPPPISNCTVACWLLSGSIRFNTRWPPTCKCTLIQWMNLQNTQSNLCKFWSIDQRLIICHLAN